jgi:hypothetical protein
MIVISKSYRNRTYHYNVLKYFNLLLAECVNVEALIYITRDEMIQHLNIDLLTKALDICTIMYHVFNI